MHTVNDIINHIYALGFTPVVTTPFNEMGRMDSYGYLTADILNDDNIKLCYSEYIPTVLYLAFEGHVAELEIPVEDFLKFTKDKFSMVVDVAKKCTKIILDADIHYSNEYEKAINYFKATVKD